MIYMINWFIYLYNKIIVGRFIFGFSFHLDYLGGRPVVKGHRTRAAKKTGHNLHKYKVHSTRKWNNASRTRPCLPIYNAAFHPPFHRLTIPSMKSMKEVASMHTLIMSSSKNNFGPTTPSISFAACSGSCLEGRSAMLLLEGTREYQSIA